MEAQNENQINPFKDIIFLLGSLFLGIALLLLNFSDTLLKNSSRSFIGDTTFWIIYPMAISYCYLLISTNKMYYFWRRQPAEYQHFRFLNWTIWLISCFALNKSLSVFQESTQWLTYYLIIAGASLYLYAFKAFLPKYLQKILYLLLSASAVLFFYFAIYLSLLYPISVIGLLFLGISFHSFVPLVLLTGLIINLVRNWKQFKTFILIGVTAPVLLAAIFVIKWHSVHQKFRFAYNETITSATDDLPNWVKLAQKIDKDWITERFLKTDIVYQTPEENLSFTPNQNFEELHQHDPLVMIAALITGKSNMADNERVKLLDLFYDARHNSQERLWTGRDLHTQNVVTQAKIYPEYRLAYTEKTIDIENKARSGWQQEAIYTFFVPEGSVVSSLSLWINGKEEKAALTTQAKADSAYTTIVGRESRDPSVVHWQEGNRLTVRVFPCTSSETRRFKIGISSPLTLENNKLVYENIYFKGPESANATESIKIDFSQAVSRIEVPWDNSPNSNNITSNGKYLASWNLKMPIVPLSKQSFNFHGNSYHLSNFTANYEPFHANNFYLDVNESWTNEEFNSVCKLLNNNTLWVYDDEFKKITPQNQSEIFDKLSANHFSLFPIHLISEPSSALLITKANEFSPILSDLKGSPFAQSFKMKHQNIKTYILGNTLSPYLKTLKELRIIQTLQGNFDGLAKITEQKIFLQNIENEQVVKIDNAQMLIQKDNSQTKNTASNTPDHLLRLFAYNHILQNIGQQYFDKTYNESFVNEASIANIVTPISSLIVLETQADYDRFDIQKNKDSLGNATLKKAGGVPEPHEWLLIGLFASFVLYYFLKGNGKM